MILKPPIKYHKPPFAILLGKQQIHLILIRIRELAEINPLDSSGRNIRGGIQGRAGARLVLLVAGAGSGVFLAIGPQAGDFNEHAEESEDAVRKSVEGLVIWNRHDRVGRREFGQICVIV